MVFIESGGSNCVKIYADKDVDSEKVFGEINAAMDEVMLKPDNRKVVVTKVCGDVCHCIYQDGSTGYFLVEIAKKTGDNYGDIAKNIWRGGKL